MPVIAILIALIAIGLVFENKRLRKDLKLTKRKNFGLEIDLNRSKNLLIEATRIHIKRM